jgi:hypothetical protein
VIKTLEELQLAGPNKLHKHNQIKIKIIGQNPLTMQAAEISSRFAT